MQRHYCLLLSIFIYIFSPSLLFAQSIQPEKILNFESSIVIHQDTSIDVTEIISLYAKEPTKYETIRQLPLHFTDQHGNTYSPEYQLKEVLVNNKPIPYHTKQTDNVLTIYLDDANTLLSPGIYVYTIQYHVNHVISLLKNANEFYWNMTGNHWGFPIIKATADVQLPPDTTILNYTGSTGAMSDKLQKFYARQVSNHQISFITTQPLKPGEGLTITIRWQQNKISPSS